MINELELAPSVPIRANGNGKMVEFPVSKWDNFLLKVGAKELTTPKSITSPLEWNRGVLGLVATLLIVLTVFAGVLISYTRLAATVDQQAEKITELKTRLDKIEEYQRADSLQKAKITGYEAGIADTKSNQHPK